jgi:hypothetical protein
MLEETLAKELADIILEQQKPLRDEIAKLKTRVAELESGGIRYCGVYQRAQNYRRGDITTHEGSMWCAVSDVAPNEQPGKCQGWQLCCMKGRDGKDARAA